MKRKKSKLIRISVFVAENKYQALQQIAVETGARGAAELLRRSIDEFLARAERRKASGG